MTQTYNITFAGDLSIGEKYFGKEGREDLQERLYNNPLSFFNRVAHLTDNTDYLIVNLESVLVSEEPQNSKFNWDTTKRTIRTLEKLGVYGVNLANDQSMGLGNETMLDMREQLLANGILPFGAGKNLREAVAPLEIKLTDDLSNKKVYIFGGMPSSKKYRDEYNFFGKKDKPGINSLNTTRMAEKIKKLREQEKDSLIIVFPHFHSHSYTQVSDKEKIKEKLRSFIDAGADYIIGHGTHSLDLIEQYNNGTIYYSIGNFVYNTTGKYSQFDVLPYSGFVNLNISNKNGKWIVVPKLYPIVTDNRKTGYSVRAVRARECKSVVKKMQQYVDPFSTPMQISYDKDDLGYYVELKETDNLLEKFGTVITGNMFKKYQEAGLLENIDENYVLEVQDYWKNLFGQTVDASLHVAFMNLTGRKDFTIVPGRIMRYELIPYFNKVGKRNMYRDKNIYDKLINTSNTAQIILKNVRGNYFNTDNEFLTQEKAWSLLTSRDSDFIIKPSITNNGVGVNKVTLNEGKAYLEGQQIEIKDLEEFYGPNFVVQEIIEQHPVMAEPHPSSVNSLRMVTLRWKGDIHYLLTFARFGAGGSVKDNAGAGGVCCGIEDNGEFMDIAIDENANKYTKHPTTGYSFEKYAKIPNFSEFKEFVINLHKDILHHDYISWDIAVGKDAKPIFIEANFSGATWIYQLASQRSVFGELTEEVVSHIYNQKQLGVSRDHRPHHFDEE
ncbi:CapA family protein [Salipaludibacillus agaradhaerens]|jgi:hypothetical protein|uniref:CapA family protein n=1 Tax=Salipaludibacillus agaradhaerens TaxID=76935 RepID=A0A9Q4FXP8_SALAG|nr:sugar-transfer associated ATP-grasp domain-containing protein [Salipaludibacillus agaradhaerens]MCR6094939.1 CapA family protein [Salipaludibacillus agaradhaerens]MCR6115503.1 CapA family protein [Salipaludibacillus agaradhaerens]